ncbi:uncharacterized protein LOC109843948 isoform X1 [Asparagus officinalis]|uniref:uncharacterized protein LOC109843948 isoform X1 n=1 Tax=Asparagus officinalis TaxID=4686 RepID=UPI00098E5BFD|nr:uncharacterized protein LOC109843948 isoform X1 [Asparagus officinalis]
MKTLKSSGRPKNKKLGNLLIILCTIFSLCFLSIFKAHYCPAPYGLSLTLKSLSLSLWIHFINAKLKLIVIAVKSQASLKLEVSDEKVDVEMVMEDALHSSFKDDEDEYNGEEGPEPICYNPTATSDPCVVEGDIRIQATSRTIFIPSSPKPSQMLKNRWTIKPLSDASPPPCTKKHSSPALIFSTYSFTGNHFHDFADLLLPLYVTSRHFHDEAHFLVSDAKPWLLAKFRRILTTFSYHKLMYAEPGIVHCFPKAFIGLTPSKPNSETLSGLRKVLRRAFRLKRVKTKATANKRPRLMIISKQGSAKDIMTTATSLGFDVRVVREPNVTTDVTKYARLVNSADVLVCVHGEGVMSLLYLPKGAVVIQVIPLGGIEKMERDRVKETSVAMGVKYLECAGEENVRMDLGRIRGTLLEALKLVRKE